ncbi:superfamily II DNA or RNA helicase [Bradyrhizobium sp. USDA 4341]
MARKARSKGVRRNVGSYYSERLKEFRATIEGRRFVRSGGQMDQLRRLVRRAAKTIDLKSRDFWDHQNEATGAIIRHLGDRNCDPQTICVVPTAGGKTEIFLRLIDAFTEVKGTETLVPNTVILVPTQNLIAQTLKRAGEQWPSMQVGHICSSPAYNEAGEAIPQGIRPITLMTYEGFVALVREGRIRARDVDYLVLDEAHRALSELRQEIFGSFIGNTLISGFSATPAFNDEQDLHLLLGEENEVINISARRLRDDGIIAPAANYVYAISLEGRAPKGGAGSPAMKRLSVRSGLEFYESYEDPVTGQRMLGKPTLGYCSDIEHARIAAGQFNRRYRIRGLKAAVLTGKDSSARQAKVLRQLEEGTIHAVMNVKLLQEGLDLPSVRVIVNFSETSSPVRASQRGGRGVRWDFDLAPDIDQTVSILDCYIEQNGAPIGSPRFYFETIGDPSIARFVRKEAARPASRTPKDRKPKPSRRAGRFEIAPHLALVAYLRRTRDGGLSLIGKLSERKEGYLSKTDLSKRLELPTAADCKRLARAWRSLIRGFDPRGFSLMENRKVDARFAKSNRRKVFCMNASELGWFCTRFRFQDKGPSLAPGPIGPKTADWCALSDTRNHFKTSTLNKELKDIFARWRADLIAGRQPMLGNRPARVEFRRSGGHTTACLHRSELRTLAEQTGMEYGRSASEWLRRDRLRVLAGEGVDRILNSIKDDLAAGRQPYVAGIAIKAKLLGDNKIIRVHKSGLKAILKEIQRERRS